MIDKRIFAAFVVTRIIFKAEFGYQNYRRVISWFFHSIYKQYANLKVDTTLELDKKVDGSCKFDQVTLADAYTMSYTQNKSMNVQHAYTHTHT